jgi:hypothetical protein
LSSGVGGDFGTFQRWQRCPVALWTHAASGLVTAWNNIVKY